MPVRYKSDGLSPLPLLPLEGIPGLPFPAGLALISSIRRSRAGFSRSFTSPENRSILAAMASFAARARAALPRSLRGVPMTAGCR